MNSSLQRPAALALATLTVAGGLACATAPAHAAAPSSYGSFTIAQGRVTTASLAVRSRATTAAPRVATVRKGQSLTLVCSVAGPSVGGNRTWYFEQDHPTGGWVSAHYVTRTAGSVPACSAYPGMHLYGVELHSPAQVNTALAGTSASFRAFIAAELRAQQRGAFKNCPATVDVQAYWGNDQAIGGVGSCGGASTLWTLRSGRWHEMAFQDYPPCTAMRSAGARHAIPGNTATLCLVRKGTGYTEVQYRP